MTHDTTHTERTHCPTCGVERACPHAGEEVERLREELDKAISYRRARERELGGVIAEKELEIERMREELDNEQKTSTLLRGQLDLMEQNKFRVGSELGKKRDECATLRARLDRAKEMLLDIADGAHYDSEYHSEKTYLSEETYDALLKMRDERDARLRGKS